MKAFECFKYNSTTLVLIAAGNELKRHGVWQDQTLRDMTKSDVTVKL